MIKLKLKYTISKQDRHVILFCYITMLLTAAFSIYINSFYTFLSYLLFAIILHISFNNKDIYHSLLIVFNTNILFNIFLNRFYIYKYGAPYFMGGSDDLRSFEIPAADLLNGIGKASLGMEGIINIIANNPSLSNVGYIFVVAFFMKVGSLMDGYYTIVPVFFNSLILTVTTYISYLISRNYYLFDLNRSKNILYWTGLFPLIIFMNSHVFRDSIFNLVVLLVVYVMLLGKRFKSLWILCLVLIICFLRIEYVPVILFIVLLLPPYLSLMKRQSSKGIKFVVNLLIALISLGSIIYLLESGLFSYILGRIEFYDLVRANTAGRFSSSIFTLPIPIRIPAKFVFLLLNPTPTFGTIEQSIMGMGTFIQVIFTPFTFYGLYLALKHHEYVAYIFLFLFLMIGFVSVDARHKTFLITIGIFLTYYSLDYIKFTKNTFCEKGPLYNV